MEDPSYSLTFDERAEYLYARIEADAISFEMVIEYTNRIVLRLKQSKRHRLLLLNESPVLPSTDCYLIASYIIKNAMADGVRIAVVDSSQRNSRKQQQITEVSRAAGLDIQTFADLETAREWLLEKDSDPGV